MPTEFIYCDTSVILSFFNEYPGRVSTIDDLFDEVIKDSEKIIVTSTFTLTEVANFESEKRRNRWKPDESAEEKFDTFWANSNLIKFIEFHEILARNARTLIREAMGNQFSLRPADAVHLASAKSINVKEFFTYDERLFKFADMMGFKICEPYVINPKLL